MKVENFHFGVLGFWGFGVLITCCLFLGFAGATPTGPDSINVTENSSWSSSGTPAFVNTSGGYISAINVSAISQDDNWKGFAGWVDGKFTLDDAGGETIYDWTLGSISGEVYATRQSGAVAWGSIDCATSGQIDTEDALLVHTRTDNISSTFNDTNTGTYRVASFDVGVGDCFAANTYVNNVSQGSSFEEFVLSDSANIIFAAKLENSAVGYDGGTYDFQMIVPENASDTFSGSTSYYLYVEIS